MSKHDESPDKPVDPSVDPQVAPSAARASAPSDPQPGEGADAAPEGEPAARRPVQSSLTGNVLIAMPRLGDPNFSHSVTLMLSHGIEGALGIVLGPTMRTSIAEVCQPFGIRWRRGPDATQLVRSGGPCEPGRIWLLHGGDTPLPDAVTVLPGIHVGSSPLLLGLLAEREDVPVMVFSGYAGWAPGQLEFELQQSSWLPGDMDADLLFNTAPSDVWEGALRRMSLTPSMLVSGAVASA
ncbi:MAG: YqgE/AlgH family protein [Polyangia bacterium]